MTQTIETFISHDLIPTSAQQTFLESLASDQKSQLKTYFDSPQSQTILPLIVFHEPSETLVLVMVSTDFMPPEPGEEGSVLAYLRAHGYDDKFIFSDCFGQLSCSSCAIEVLKGKPKNPTPREEEYDMLDIDENRPPTACTRLGCQVQVGDEALLIKIRK